MGIDIYAEGDERRGTTNRGYIREAYHGEPYPSFHLLPELFEAHGMTRIPSATLRERLPETLKRARERMRRVYELTDENEIEANINQYTDFVEFCEELEDKSGDPPTVSGSW